jgi:hypothetical protein
MLKSERNFLHAANAITGISGIVYFAMLYFIEGSNEFSILNHPWQDAVRDWHIVLAPLLIFAVALILKGHILKKSATITGGEAESVDCYCVPYSP